MLVYGTAFYRLIVKHGKVTIILRCKYTGIIHRKYIQRSIQYVLGTFIIIQVGDLFRDINYC